MEGVEPSDETLMELPIELEGKRRRDTTGDEPRSTNAGPLFLGALALILVVVGANVLLSDRSLPDPPVDEDATVDDLVPDVLAAFPDADYTNLTDGQSVRYELDALPFSVETITVVCVRDADDAESILDECDSGTAQRRTTSPGGVITADITAHREITLAGGKVVDCAERACEFRTFAEKASGVVVGRASLGWSTESPSTPAPRLSLTSDAVSTGSSFTVTGSGFPAETSVTVQPCRLAVEPDPFACDQVLSSDQIETDGDGAFRYDGIADWPDDVIAGCVDAEEGLCVVTVAVPGVERQPAAVPFPSNAEDDVIGRLAVLRIFRAEGLADGDEVTIVPAESIIDSDLEPYICAIDAFPTDCAWLDPSESVTDGRYEVPRQFMTLRGTRHDCVVDGDCVVSLFRLFDPDTRLDVRLSFDPEADLRPAAAMSAEPAAGLVAGTAVTVTVPVPITPSNLSVCAVGEHQTCDPLGTAPSPEGGIITVVDPILDTPAGSHDCTIDGPCELVGWDADTLTRFEPVPLAFESG